MPLYFFTARYGNRNSYSKEEHDKLPLTERLWGVLCGFVEAPDGEEVMNKVSERLGTIDDSNGGGADCYTTFAVKDNKKAYDFDIEVHEFKNGTGFLISEIGKLSRDKVQDEKDEAEFNAMCEREEKAEAAGA